MPVTLIGSSVGGAGIAGTDGLNLLNGAGVPDSGTGIDGEFYIDTTNNNIYGPKASGAWGSATSIVGPQGATGAAGTDGILNYQHTTFDDDVDFDINGYATAKTINYTVQSATSQLYIILSAQCRYKFAGTTNSADVMFRLRGRVDQGTYSVLKELRMTQGGTSGEFITSVLVIDTVWSPGATGVHNLEFQVNPESPVSLECRVNPANEGKSSFTVIEFET